MQRGNNYIFLDLEKATTTATKTLKNWDDPVLQPGRIGPQKT